MKNSFLWIIVTYGRPEVVEGLVPEATDTKAGLMPADFAKYFKYAIPAVLTNNTQTYIQISIKGKFSGLLAFTRNATNASLFFITIRKGFYIKNIAGETAVFYESGNTLIVSNDVVWSEFSILPLTGTIDDVSIIDTTPEDFTEVIVS